MPDYFKIYTKWIEHYERTGDQKSKAYAYHYARVAEEMGQAIVDEDITLDDLLVDQ
tara:strand:+ start:207 stop:374 length:168 start_codon:yes stop_codon:yes gene_type:complete